MKRQASYGGRPCKGEAVVKTSYGTSDWHGKCYFDPPTKYKGLIANAHRIYKGTVTFPDGQTKWMSGRTLFCYYEHDPSGDVYYLEFLGSGPPTEV